MIHFVPIVILLRITTSRVCSFLYYIVSSILCSRNNSLFPESHTVVLFVLSVSRLSVAAARQLPGFRALVIVRSLSVSYGDQRVLSVTRAVIWIQKHHAPS